MADRTKRVDRNVPVLQRSQNFTNSDASQGDVLKVADSLGYPASHVTIETQGGPLKVVFNVHQTVFKRWSPHDQGFLYGTAGFENLTSGISYMTNTQSGVGVNPAGSVNIEANTTYTLDKDLAISDIQLVTVSGLFDIFVS